MKKILIIDDSEELREMVTDILEFEGFQVITAQNGLEGMAKAIRDQPDLILCDLRMPQLNGYQLLYQIRACSETSLIPFVFVTGHTVIHKQFRGIDLGFNGHLVKPFTHHELLNTISQGISSQRHLIQV